MHFLPRQNLEHADEQGFPWHDVALVVVITAIGAGLAMRFELSESIFAWTRPWEHWQIDELPTTLIVLCAGLAWFGWRRYGDARTELSRRRAAEARLASLVLDNRRLAQRYEQAQEAERKFLARELHDELGQYFNAIKLDAVAIQRNTLQDAAILRASSAIIRHTDHVHGVVRDLIRKLRPIGLDELGLKAALEHHVSDWQRRLPDVRFCASLQGDLDALAEPVTLTLYRLLQEGITNISRHAQARHVTLRLLRSTAAVPGACDEVVFSLVDDGRGCDLTVTQRGLGLIGMRERVGMLGGELQVTTQPGKGFTLVARIPAGASS